MNQNDKQDIRLCRQVAADGDGVTVAMTQQPAMPQADWSQAPAWAMFWAVDSNGRCKWYEFEPTRMDYGDIWVSMLRQEECRRVLLPIGIDWRTTLQARTTATP